MSRRSASLMRLPHFAQWAVLLLASLAVTALLEAAGLPAAVLLGPMISAIFLVTNGGTLRVPQLPHYAAQAVIGCLVAGAITPAIIVAFLQKWPLFIGAVFAIVLVGASLGWLLSRLRILPATTAVWGLCPGAASAMMLMAEAFGADAQLVAFMQYLRVVLVTATASLVVRLWHSGGAGAAYHIAWFPPLHWSAFGQTIALAVLGGSLGYISRLPIGVMLVPTFLGAALHAAGLITLQLPPWLLAVSYALLGWRIGLGFTRQILIHAARALPQTIMSIAVMIAFCGGLAFILIKILEIDPLTAYLATSPGGMDSVAIIAASSKVDFAFVIALQMVRFVVVLLAGPSISRFVANRIGAEQAPKRPPAINETFARIREDEGDLD